MKFSVLINWTSPFPILGLLGGIFHFYSNIKRNVCKQTVEKPDQTPQNAASCLVLRCLQMSHKKDASRIWVKLSQLNYVVSPNVINYVHTSLLHPTENIKLFSCKTTMSMKFILHVGCRSRAEFGIVLKIDFVFANRADFIQVFTVCQSTHLWKGLKHDITVPEDWLKIVSVSG